jgi:hypothetical protein
MNSAMTQDQGQRGMKTLVIGRWGRGRLIGNRDEVRCGC